MLCNQEELSMKISHHPVHTTKKKKKSLNFMNNALHKWHQYTQHWFLKHYYKHTSSLVDSKEILKYMIITRLSVIPKYAELSKRVIENSLFFPLN